MAASSSQERNISNIDASDLATVENLKKLLIEYGSELLKPCDSTEELLRKLDNLEHVLCRITQDHKSLVALALQPSKEALVAKELIRHAEMDVRASVASCITEIIRITTPDEPYGDDQMKEYFQLVNSTLKSLPCMSGRVYSKVVSMLGTISCCESCVVMLDLRLHRIIRKMFHLFFNGIRSGHSIAIFTWMVNIMAAIIHKNIDSDKLSLELAKILLARLKKEDQNVSPVSFKLAEDTLRKCSDDLKTYVPEAARRLGIPVEHYAELVASLLQDATQRDYMDSEATGVYALRHWEASLAVIDDLHNFSEGNNPDNMKIDGNSKEKQITSHLCEEPENLDCPNQQEDQKPDDGPRPRKRSRTPNSLIRPEEGYNPYMLGSWKSMRESHYRTREPSSFPIS